MLEELAEQRSRAAAFAARFDPQCLTGREAAKARAEATALKNIWATVEAMAGARETECGAWRREGDRCEAGYLARKTGVSVSSATDTLKTAERLADQPGVAAAARRGELSPAQASLVSGAVAVDPDAERALLAKAKALPLKELQEACSAVRAAASDPEAIRRKIQRERFVRSWNDAEGAGHLHAQGTPEDIAAIMARISSERDEVFAEARAEGRCESPDAYAFDALLRICTGKATETKVGAKVIVRVDFDALLRGHPLEGEVCEVAGCPVAVSAVEELLQSGSTFLAPVVTKGDKLIGAMHFGRAPTALQQTGLEWLYPTCAVAGCSARAKLQRDHREDWARTRFTLFDLLDLLCGFHHGLKTTQGWGLVEGRGKRAFVPPDDSRHPGHAKDPPTAA
jgi:hypothetical protein